MKRIIRLILTTTALAAVFTSCHEDDIVPTPSGPAKIVIGLNTPQTRSDVKDSPADIYNENFGIFACHDISGTSTLYNSLGGFGKVTSLGGTNYGADLYEAVGDPSPGTYYWPTPASAAGHSLKFFAWYPVTGTEAPTVTNRDGVNKKMTMTYTVEENITNQKDLMAAVHTPSWGGDVELGFRHALSRISFSFTKESGAAPYTVSGIQLKGVAKTGTLAVTDTNNDHEPEFAWSGTDPAVGNVVTYDLSTTPVTVSGTSTDFKSFLMIPLSAAELSNVKFVVTIDGTPKEFDMPTDLVSEWEAGGHYAYSFTMNEVIAYTPTIRAVWGEDGAIATPVTNGGRSYQGQGTTTLDASTYTNTFTITVYSTGGEWEPYITTNINNAGLTDLDATETLAYISYAVNDNRGSGVEGTERASTTVTFTLPKMTNGQMNDNIYQNIYFKDKATGIVSNMLAPITQYYPGIGLDSSVQNIITIDNTGGLRRDGIGWIVYFKWGSCVAMTARATGSYTFDAGQVAWAPSAEIKQDIITDIAAKTGDEALLSVPYISSPRYTEIPPTATNSELGDPCQLLNETRAAYPGDGPAGLYFTPNTLPYLNENDDEFTLTTWNVNDFLLEGAWSKITGLFYPRTGNIGPKEGELGNWNYPTWGYYWSWFRNGSLASMNNRAFLLRLNGLTGRVTVPLPTYDGETGAIIGVGGSHSLTSYAMPIRCTS